MTPPKFKPGDLVICSHDEHSKYGVKVYYGILLSERRVCHIGFMSYTMYDALFSESDLTSCFEDAIEHA